MMRLAIFFVAASFACAQTYVATPRTITDKEYALILGSCLNNSLATNCNGTGEYGIGFNIQNPNTITAFTQMDSLSIKAWHGVLHQWAAGAQHVASFDLFDELQAYQAAEVAAGRGPFLITSGGQAVYWDTGPSSTPPYGKQPIFVCDPRFVRFMANEQIRRRMLSPSNPGGEQSPQYQDGWQSGDEGFVLTSVYGFPGGIGDGSTWDSPFPQNQGQWTACVASYFSQLYAFAPDIFITLNQGSLAEPNGTINNNDLALFQQIYNSSPNLNIDREQFVAQGTSTTDTQVLFNILQNITGWLLTTGRTAAFRADVDTSAGQRLSSALAYLLVREGNSFYGAQGAGNVMVDPNSATGGWAQIFEQMGNPTGKYVANACSPSCGSDYSYVVFSRTYEGGLVYCNNGTTTQTVTLPGGTWYNSAGSVVTTLTLLSYAGGVDTQVCQYVTNANYTSAPIVQQPQISPLGSTAAITGTVTATITTGTAGATICFTEDGTMPTAVTPGTCSHGTTYTGPISISTTTTLTAIATLSGNTNSWERATTFTITATNPTAQFVLATDSATPFFTLTYAAITLSNPSASTVTVNYTVAGDSNIVFSPSSGTAVFAPGQTAVAVPINASLVASSAQDSLVATIGTGTGYSVGSQATYTYTIKRDNLPNTYQYAEINAATCATGRSDNVTNNSNCTSANTMLFGVVPATPEISRSALTFPLTSIPSNATISKATMLGYIPTNTDAGYPVTGTATCTSGTVTLPVGTNAMTSGQIVGISGIVPSGYNAISAQLTGRTASTVSYAVPSCPGAYVSGGTVTLFVGPTSVFRLLNPFTQTTANWSNFFVNTANVNWGSTPTDSEPAVSGPSAANTATDLLLMQTANHFNLTADVAAMVAGTETNFGWVLEGPEASPNTETATWNTSISSNPPPGQPSLLIRYSVPSMPVITTLSPLYPGTVSVAYSQTFAATGGTVPLSWSVTGGSLPTGLNLSTSGVLSGTPSVAGVSSFTVTVTDANSVSSSKPFSLTIAASSSANVLAGTVTISGTIIH